MKLIELRKVDFCFEDKRGFLTQLVHEGFNQVNVLYTKKGEIRGKHYHKISVEVFYIVNGSVEVEASKENCTEKYVFNKGDFFQIKPHVIHSMFFLEDCLMVQMYDRCIEKYDGTKDIYTE